MSQIDRLERDLTAWFADTALPRTPEYGAEILRQTARMRQRPRWTFPALWLPVGPWPSRRSRLGLLILGVLVLLGSVLAVAIIGALNRPDLLAGPSVPPRLYGDFERRITASDDAVPAGYYTLDFNASTFIRLPDGSPAEWAGRVISVESVEPSAWRIRIKAEGPCGGATYTVRGNQHRSDGTLPAPDTLWFRDAVDDCADRAAILEPLASWRRPASWRAALLPGETYSSFAFTEPFRFVMPEMDPTLSRYRASQWGTTGGLKIGNGYSWSSYFYDDVPVPRDLCDSRDGVLPDVPDTPEAVDAWLRSSSLRVVPEATTITVDGRTALRYDGLEQYWCIGSSPLPGHVFIGFRIYAIPTGDDTILYVVDSDVGGSPYVESGADELVRSIDFD
jgi:hypothetical protein